MKASSEANFNSRYETHLKHLRPKGLRPKTIEAYARAIRRIGAYFDYRIDDLSERRWGQRKAMWSVLAKLHSPARVRRMKQCEH